MISTDMQVNSARQQSFFADTKNLERLKDNGEDPESLRAIAKEFEAIFIQMVLKSMRDCKNSFKSEYFNSSDLDTYEEMYDKQLAVHMSECDHLGISEAIVKQFTKTPPKEQEVTTGKLVIPKISHYPTIRREPKVIDNKEIIEPEIEINSPQSFVQALWPHAVESSKELNVDPKVLLAQAALETGWGNKIIKKPGKNSFNVFNIKASKSWQGDKFLTKTIEVKDGLVKKVNDLFRGYNNYRESFKDYVKLIKNNSRYKEALSVSSQAKSYLEAIQSAGYATDPNYAKKIMGVYKSPILNSAINQIKKGQ